MLVMLMVMFAFAPLRVDAQTLTPPEALATMDAARVQVEVARVQATSVSRLATANAPTATALPTSTPIPPTMTPPPTATATSTPTPAATETTQPSATAQQTPAVTSTPAPARTAKTIYDDWPLVVLILGGALAIIIALYRLLVGRETILPGRGNRSDDGRSH